MSLGWIKELVYEYPARSLAANLPRAMGSQLGRVLAVVERATTRAATNRRLRANLARALDLPEDSPQIRNLARSLILHHIWHLLEYGLRRQIGTSWKGISLEVSGFEHAERILAQKRGLVVAAGHLSTWVLYPAAFAWRGYTTALIERDALNDDPPEAWMARQKLRARRPLQETRHGYTTFYTGGAGKRAAQLLREGGVVVIAVDYPPPAETEKIRFLGVERAAPTGAARLAIEGNAGVVAAQLERIEFGRNRLTLFPVDVPQTGDSRKDVVTLARSMAAQYETFIRANPGQWSWQLWRDLR